MLFHSVTFLVFFTITVSLLLAIRQHRSQKLILGGASVIFYMWWNPAFILLIAFSTGTDYFVARRLELAERPAARRGLLLVSIVSNLGLLAFFKYVDFAQDTMLLGLRVLGFHPNWADLHVILPVGISFYTFRQLSYHRRLPAEGFCLHDAWTMDSS